VLIPCAESTDAIRPLMVEMCELYAGDVEVVCQEVIKTGSPSIMINRGFPESPDSKSSAISSYGAGTRDPPR